MSEKNTKQQWSKKQKKLFFEKKTYQTNKEKMSDENDFYMKKNQKKTHCSGTRTHTQRIERIRKKNSATNHTATAFFYIRWLSKIKARKWRHHSLTLLSKKNFKI